jgi:hypothetical protein
MFFVTMFAGTLFGWVDPYAGVIGGISTLSADAGARSTAQGLSLSAYSPGNGGAVNLFVGAHLHNYFSVQANYIWNQNSLVLNSTSSATPTFYQQSRSSSQHAGVLDFLLYFRRKASWIRPYLGTGFGIIHLTSTEERSISSGGSPLLPPQHSPQPVRCFDHTLAWTSDSPGDSAFVTASAKCSEQMTSANTCLHPLRAASRIFKICSDSYSITRTSL